MGVGLPGVDLVAAADAVDAAAVALAA
jgi:hypothetical protein